MSPLPGATQRQWNPKLLLPLDPFYSLGDRIIHYGLHQADCQSASRVDLFCPYKHFQSNGFADQAGQTLRATPPRDQS